MVGTRKCKRCTKVYVHEYFLQFPICGCRLCAYCEAEALQLKNFVCLCGYGFDQSTIQTVNTMNETCKQCNQTKNLIKGFTSIRCSDHIFCLKCLEELMKKPEPRCPQDHRHFAQYEIETAKGMFKRQCGLFCGRTLGSSEALPLDCDCCYCESCALYEIKRRITNFEAIDKCFSCGRDFPNALKDRYMQLVKVEGFMQYTLKFTIGQLANYQAPNCVFCFTAIGRDQNITLTCGHSFHKGCLSDQASSVANIELQCGQCKQPMAGHIIQQVMTVKQFDQYNMKLISARKGTVYCPNCGTQHYSEEGMMQVGCQICNFQFCAMCLGQWGITHDTQRCKFESLQKRIAEIAPAMGPEDVIAQCPTCKTPYLKDKECEHVKCPPPGCPDWCFLCSALRPPIMAHGNHWHRPECKFVGTEDISTEPMKQDCPECMKLGRRCDPPPLLKVSRRFDFDEY